MAVALDYDQLAADYAANRGVHPGVLATLVAGGNVHPGSQVLEVGSGTGNYAVAIAERVGCAVTGVEPSAAMRASAVERSSAVAFRPGRAEELPFDVAWFDLVFSVDVIHHVADRPAFFREAFRVLAPGGRLCTVTDSADDIRRRVPLSAFFPETVEVELARYPATASLRDEMATAGFASTAEEGVEHVYSLTDAAGYRARAYSSLHLIDDRAFAAGLARLEAALADGPVTSLSLYTLLWGTAPDTILKGRIDA